LDELIADYRGVVAAVGYYRADWFLRFVGLEAFPKYRHDGRLQNYRGHPPLSEEAFRILQCLVKAAAENLERFDRRYASQPRTLEDQVTLLVALTTLTLEELAGSSAISFIEKGIQQQQERFGWINSCAPASPDLHHRMKG
jgi:hypothetical protein